MKIRKVWSVVLVLSVAFGSVEILQAQDEEEEEEAIELIFSEAERAELGIVTATAALQRLATEITAPAEVMLNAYQTTQVATRVAAQVVERHARMGDTIRSGDPLVTLSSVDMAAAVGDLLVNDREWRRVDMLGRDVLAESRYVTAEVERQQAYAKVLAYGMPHTELERLLSEADASEATGEYTLYAPHDGVVIQDDFLVGEVVEPGRLLMEVSDLSTLWVEGRVDPELAAAIDVGDVVRVSADDEVWVAGEVSQRHQRINEQTRTLGVRIEIANDGEFAPGQFVNIAMVSGEAAAAVAVPRQAVTLILGEPMVFILEEDEFVPQPIEPSMNTSEWTALPAGLEVGDEIAVSGVFYLKSLLLKSQIGDTD